MNRHRHRSAAFLVLAALIGGCAPRIPTTQPSPTEIAFSAAAYRDLETKGRVFWLDAATSSLRIFVRRAGPLASQGHNHVIVAGELDGAVFLPSSGLGGARFDVVMPVGSLVVDPPALRASLGDDFASELTPRNREATRRNMLDTGVLDAASHPRVGVRSVALAGALPSPTATVAIDLRGVRREVAVPLGVRIDGGQLVTRGSLTIRQTEFGISPFSVAAGLLRVADEVHVEFELIANVR